MGLQICKSKWGIASRVGNTIYVNQELEKYPKLYKAILNHEKKHTSKWNLSDLKLDLSGKDLIDHKKEYYKFILLHPKSWVQFIPVCKQDGIWQVDLSLIIFYTLSAIIMLLIIRWIMALL